MTSRTKKRSALRREADRCARVGSGEPDPRIHKPNTPPSKAILRSLQLVKLATEDLDDYRATTTLPETHYEHIEEAIELLDAITLILRRKAPAR